MRSVIILVLVSLGLSGCSQVSQVRDFVKPDTVSLTEKFVVPELAKAVVVEKLSVIVPRTLVASEANSYKPNADIVWREDPVGDRHAQVQTIVATAMERGVALLQGEAPILVDVVVDKFHALTQKTRYTVGGTHQVDFKLTLRDAETGVIMAPTRLVRTQLRAYGGRQAVDASLRGETQKLRISEHLRRVIVTEIGTSLELAQFQPYPASQRRLGAMPRPAS